MRVPGIDSQPDPFGELTGKSSVQTATADASLVVSLLNREPALMNTNHLGSQA